MIGWGPEGQRSSDFDLSEGRGERYGLFAVSCFLVTMLSWLPICSFAKWTLETCLTNSSFDRTSPAREWPMRFRDRCKKLARSNRGPPSGLARIATTQGQGALVVGKLDAREGHLT